MEWSLLRVGGAEVVAGNAQSACCWRDRHTLPGLGRTRTPRAMLLTSLIVYVISTVTPCLAAGLLVGLCITAAYFPCEKCIEESMPKILHYLLFCRRNLTMSPTRPKKRIFQGQKPVF